MTPHYWQLFASQHTDLLFLPPLTWIWLGFRSGAITSTWCWILTKQRLSSLVYLGLWTLLMMIWSCLGFPFTLVPTSTFLAWLTRHTFEDHVYGIASRLSKNWYFEFGEMCICGHLSVLRCYYVFVLPILDPEWHTLNGLTGSALVRYSEGRTFAVRPVQLVSLVICKIARIAVCNTWSSGGTALCRVGGATSQLDLPPLTPLSVAGCG